MSWQDSLAGLVLLLVGIVAAIVGCHYLLQVLEMLKG